MAKGESLLDLVLAVEQDPSGVQACRGMRKVDVEHCLLPVREQHGAANAFLLLPSERAV